MPVSPTRRAVLVLGASGALGSAIVHRLVRNGDVPLLIGTFHRNRQAARELQAQTACCLRALDASDALQMRALWHELPRTLLGEGAILTSVVWAIGVSRDGLMMRTSRANWEHSQRVNLDGAFLAVRAALQWLPRGGRVVLLASRVGETGSAGQSAYAAHKAALLSLSKSAAREGGPRKIAVNAVCPGFTPSAMTQIVAYEKQKVQRQRDVFGALGSAQSTANVVSWLLSEESEAVSGQVWHADARVD